jgi:hypothetical protein
MPGGLINIVSYGIGDLFLTGAPEITFFKIVYRRHTNFAIESVNIPFGDITMGNEYNIPIPKIGDLLSKSYIQIDIPSIHLLKINTATDLSQTEKAILETPYYITYPGAPNFVTDYKLIKKFMAINTIGYRTALLSVSIKNQTTEQFINTVLDSINNAAIEPNIINNYHIALNTALAYEKDIVLNKDIFVLDYKSSDLDYILKDILSQIPIQTVNTIDYTLQEGYKSVQDVMDIILKAIKICVKVTDYYFKKVQIINNDIIQSESKYAKFAWVEKLGFAMIDYVEVLIGGESIDKHYSDWINIWYELTSNIEQEILFNKMIGNIDIMTTFDRNAKPAYKITVPLYFWFCRKTGLAFPLVALQYNDISFNIKFKTLDQCAYIEKLPTVDQNGNVINLTDNVISFADIWENSGYNISANLLIDYVYLETNERKRFAQSAHEYLIETVHVLTDNSVTTSKSEYQLDYVGVAKELVWIVQKEQYITDNVNTNKLWFNYSTNSTNGDNPITKTKLLLNGASRLDFFDSTYYNYLQPHNHHTKTPSSGINIYSFALFPEQHQPSGSCNFNVITYPLFSLTVADNMFTYKPSEIDPSISKDSINDIPTTTAITIKIYTHKKNVLRVIHGMASKAFQ